jgi:hypothetical protein
MLGQETNADDRAPQRRLRVVDADGLLLMPPGVRCIVLRRAPVAELLIKLPGFAAVLEHVQAHRPPSSRPPPHRWLLRQPDGDLPTVLRDSTGRWSTLTGARRAGTARLRPPVRAERPLDDPTIAWEAGRCRAAGRWAAVRGGG